MKNIFLIVFLLISFQINAQTNCEIKGKVLQNNLEYIYLQSMIDTQNIDSCQIVDNAFNFHFFSGENEFFRIYVHQPEDMIIMTNPNENIFVEFDAINPQNSLIEGSKESQNISQFNKLLNKYDEKQEKLIKKINNQRNKEIAGLINKSPENLSNLLFLYILDYEQYTDVYQKVKNNIKDKEHSLSKEFFRKIQGLENQTIGKEMIDFCAVNPSGDTIILSDFKSKIIILNFVASYNLQSMRNAENLTKFLKMNSNENNSMMVLVNFFLDEFKEDFCRASQKLNDANIVNISDFKSYNSPIIKALNIEQIPYLLIIDQNFKINSKNMYLFQKK